MIWEATEDYGAQRRGASSVFTGVSGFGPREGSNSGDPLLDCSEAAGV